MSDLNDKIMILEDNKKSLNTIINKLNQDLDSIMVPNSV